jgi:hypothetical protein
MHYRGYQKGERKTVQGNQKADSKVKRTALTGGWASPSLTAALFLCSLSEQYTSQNRLGLRMKEEIFYQMDGGSLLMATLPYLSHWLPHLSSSSMKELTQGGQLSRPPWPSIFISPNSAT